MKREAVGRKNENGKISSEKRIKQSKKKYDKLKLVAKGKEKSRMRREKIKRG